MKKLLIFLTVLALCCVGLHATPIITTLTNGVASVPPQSSPFYYVAWTETTSNGATKNSRMGYGYVVPPTGKTSTTSTPWNLYSATTYAEMAAYASTNSLVPAIPAQKTGQP